MTVKTQTFAAKVDKLFSNTDSSISILPLLEKIDAALDTDLPLTQQLNKTNSILLNAFNVDAIWCLSLNPLPPTACGLVKTPLGIAPHAEICIADQLPLEADHWKTAHTLLGRVINNQTAHYFPANTPPFQQIDADLGDVLFGSFDVVPRAIIPLVVDFSVWGALIIGTKKPKAKKISAENQKILAYLARHLAKNMRQLHLAQSSKQYTDTIFTLTQIAHTITSSLNIDDVIQRTMAGINSILDVEAGSLLLLDEKTGELYFKITLRGENKQITSYRLKQNEGIAGWVAAKNQPVIVNNVATDPRFLAKIDKAINFKTKSLLGVPLIVQGKPIGVLEVLNKRSGPFNEKDLDLLVSMAASLGIALKNATLYDDAQKRARQNEIINQITAAINAGKGFSETAKSIFTQLNRLFAFSRISVSLIDKPTKKIQQWLCSLDGVTEYKDSFVPIANSRLEQIIRQEHRDVKHNISNLLPNTKFYPDDQILLSQNINSQITVLLSTQNTPYGCLNLGSRNQNAYSNRELTLLEQLSPHLSIVIEKALLIDDMKQHANELHQLNRLSEMLVSTIEIGSIIDTALYMLPHILPNDVHGIVIANEEGAHTGLVSPNGFSKTEQTIQEMVNTFIELSEFSTVEIITKKIIDNNLSVTDYWQPRATLALPILTRHGPQGIIYTASGKKERFGDDFLRVFSLLASQVTAAVKNTHLFQQVEKERAQLEAILSSGTDAVLVVDQRGRIVLGNPAAWRMLGAKEPQNKQPLAEKTHLKSLIDLFDTARQEGKTTGEILLDDGRTFFANLSPVSVGKTDVVGWVATMQDVSYFKELDHLKNEFVNTVSHDLRSPLSSILIATKLINQVGTVTEEQNKLLEIVERRVADMAQLTDDLLDVGRIEAGIDMTLAPCNLEQIIIDVINGLSPQADEKTIEMNVTFVDSMPPIMANANRLQQILHNLISNAIKYTPNNGKITVKAYPHGDEIRLLVIDTGIGIPVSDQPHIFEKFYRVKNQHALNVSGTGLGLAIVKGIVEKHNGRIWLKSILGEGSTFTIALPIFRKTN